MSTTVSLLSLFAFLYLWVFAPWVLAMGALIIPNEKETLTSKKLNLAFQAFGSRTIALYFFIAAGPIWINAVPNFIIIAWGYFLVGYMVFYLYAIMHDLMEILFAEL